MYSMSENVTKKTGFVWDEKKIKVAGAMAKGDRTQNQIATEFGITPRTIQRWAEHPEFQRQIDEIIQDIDIAQKSERIKIAKKEIKRILKKLELNEDRPTSRDLVALLKYVGEEIGDYTESKTIKLIWADEDKKDDRTDPEDPV